MEDFRKVLQVFYSTHNPDRVNTIDLILENYKGREKELLIHLGEKYSHEKVNDAIILSGVLRTNSESITESIDSKDSDETAWFPTSTAVNVTRFFDGIKWKSSEVDDISYVSDNKNQMSNTDISNYEIREQWRKDQITVITSFIYLQTTY